MAFRWLADGGPLPYAYWISKSGERFSCDKSEICPEVIKLFSYSFKLSEKFQLLIKTRISTNEEVSCFKSLIDVEIIMLINVNIYEHDKFCAPMS